MNEFAAKKLGEVLAFARVGVETAEKGRAGFEQAFAPEYLDTYIATNQTIASRIEEIAVQEGVSEVTFAKAEKTGAKLREMRDMYVGDEWDNSAELLEWSGFFVGAAIAHWYLVQAAAEKLGRPELATAANQTIAIYQETFKAVCVGLHDIGKEKA